MSAPKGLTILAKIEPKTASEKISRALTRFGGNVNAAAGWFGVSGRTLYRLMSEKHKRQALEARAGK